MGPGAIAILTHACQGLDPGYSLAAIAEHCWRPRGWRVLLHQGLAPPPPADLAILHVDLTRVPAGYLALAGCYPRTLNGAVRDIGKRAVADGQVRAGDGYDGPVVVKTELNHGGTPEMALAEAGRRWTGRALAGLRCALPPRWTGGLPGGRYQVYRRAREVPAWVWRRPELVVQRLFTERQRGLYALNQWYFLGRGETVSTLLSPQPFVNMATVTERLPLHGEVPESLRARRAELGFDYGKFDYVVEQGEARLLDANKTPHLAGDPPTTERMLAIHGALAAGLDA
jgi:hypothetical protein